jgi:hypothetical protein
MVQGIPLPSGLIALRIDYTSISDSYSIKKDCITVGGYSFEVPENWLEPHGSDYEIVKTFAAGDTDVLAGMLAAAIQTGFRNSDVVEHAELLERIGRKLIALAARDQATEAAGTEIAPRAS